MTELSSSDPANAFTSHDVVTWTTTVETAVLRSLNPLLQNQDFTSFSQQLKKTSNQYGWQRAINLLQRLEIINGWRDRPRIGIFDHTLQLVGGGQKYGCTIAAVLSRFCFVTLITNRPVTIAQLENWYNLDLSSCRIEIIPLPFFERPEFGQIDPGIVTVRSENPFHLISRASGAYDIFFNNSMLEMVYPLANVSVFMCHFPERRRSTYFYVDRYHHLLYNSEYTASWIRRKWGLEPTAHIYPPIDMGGTEKPPSKESIILSVARFEPGGSKQQDRMIEVFLRLRRKYPEQMKEWRLILAGGSPADNPFLERLKLMAAEESGAPIDIRVNIPNGELRELYAKASLFWHLCGLQQTDPARVEHFGMTIVEAMQNRCVPVVFDGGGQREIVIDGKTGFRFRDRAKLMMRTLELISDPVLRANMAEAARERSRLFERNTFETRIQEFFVSLIDQYKTLS